MGNLVLMFFCALIVPVSMIVLGYYFKKGGTKEPNWIFGYRSSMSMKNHDTWLFAHEYCGKIWIRWGYILLVIAIISMLFLLRDEMIIFNALTLIQVVVLIGSIFPVEIALKKTFDKDGNRKVLNIREETE